MRIAQCATKTKKKKYQNRHLELSVSKRICALFAEQCRIFKTNFRSFIAIFI